MAAFGQNISRLRYFTQQKQDFELLIALRGKCYYYSKKGRKLKVNVCLEKLYSTWKRVLIYMHNNCVKSNNYGFNSNYEISICKTSFSYRH